MKENGSSNPYILSLNPTRFLLEPTQLLSPTRFCIPQAQSSFICFLHTPHLLPTPPASHFLLFSCILNFPCILFSFMLLFNTIHMFISMSHFSLLASIQNVNNYLFFVILFSRRPQNVYQILCKSCMCACVGVCFIFMLYGLGQWSLWRSNVTTKRQRFYFSCSDSFILVFKKQKKHANNKNTKNIRIIQKSQKHFS